MGSRTNAAAPSRRAHWLRTTAVIAAVSVGGLGAAGFLGQEALPLPEGPAPTALATTTGPTAAPTTPDPAAPTAAPTTEDPAADTRQALALLAPALSEASHFDATLREVRLRDNAGVVVESIEFEGSGVLTVVPGETPAPDPAREPFTVLVRVEEGIGIDPAAFTEQAFEILNDPRGWGEIDQVSFARTSDPEAADVTLTLASPATTEELCGELPTRGYTSCGRVGAVNINAARWAHNADAFLAAGGSDEEYRAYLLNHEFGHVLDHWHEHCPAPGERAPVMLQQTLDLAGCTPNGWPNP